MAILLAKAGVAEFTAAINGLEITKRTLTFAEAKAMVRERPLGAKVTAINPMRVAMYSIWFETALPAHNGCRIYPTDDLFLIHESEDKNGPWSLLSFREKRAILSASQVVSPSTSTS